MSLTDYQIASIIGRDADAAYPGDDEETAEPDAPPSEEQYVRDVLADGLPGMTEALARQNYRHGLALYRRRKAERERGDG